MGRGRKTSFFIHLETQYAKTDSKNEIYAKNWVRRTWIEKVNHGEKSTVWSAMTSADRWVTSADDVAVMMSPRANVSRRNLAHDSAWQSVMDLGGTWHWAETSGGAWERVRGPMKTKFHRKVDRRDFFPMVQSVVWSEKRKRRWRQWANISLTNYKPWLSFPEKVCLGAHQNGSKDWDID